MTAQHRPDEPPSTVARGVEANSGVDPARDLARSREVSRVPDGRTLLSPALHQPETVLIKGASFHELKRLAHELCIPVEDAFLDTLYQGLIRNSLPSPNDLATFVSTGPSCEFQLLQGTEAGQGSLTNDTEISITAGNVLVSPFVLAFGVTYERDKEPQMNVAIHWDKALLLNNPGNQGEGNRWQRVERILEILGLPPEFKGIQIVDDIAPLPGDRVELKVSDFADARLDEAAEASEVPLIDIADPNLSQHPAFVDFVLGHADIPEDIRAAMFASQIPNHLLPTEITSAGVVVMDGPDETFSWEEAFEIAIQDSPHTTLRFILNDGILLFVSGSSSLETVQEDFEALRAKRETLEETGHTKSLTAPTYSRLIDVSQTEAVQIAARLGITGANGFIDGAFRELLRGESPNNDFLIDLARSSEQVHVIRKLHFAWDADFEEFVPKRHNEIAFRSGDGTTRLILSPHDELPPLTVPAEDLEQEMFVEEEVEEGEEWKAGVAEDVGEETEEEGTLDLWLEWRPASGVDARDLREIERRWSDVGTIVEVLDAPPVPEDLMSLALAPDAAREIVVNGSDNRIRLRRDRRMVPRGDSGEAEGSTH